MRSCDSSYDRRESAMVGDFIDAVLAYPASVETHCNGTATVAGHWLSSNELARAIREWDDTPEPDRDAYLTAWLYELDQPTE